MREPLRFPLPEAVRMVMCVAVLAIGGCSYLRSGSVPVAPMTEETRQFAQDMLPLDVQQRRVYIESHRSQYKQITSDPGQSLALRKAMNAGKLP